MRLVQDDQVQRVSRRLIRPVRGEISAGGMCCSSRNDTSRPGTAFCDLMVNSVATDDEAGPAGSGEEMDRVSRISRLIRSGTGALRHNHGT